MERNFFGQTRSLGPKGAGLLLLIWLALSAAQGIQKPTADAEIRIQKQMSPLRTKPRPDPVKPKGDSEPSKRTIKQKELVVAIIDTGIDVRHPYLKDYIWTNSGEMGFDKNGKPKGTNGRDDDENGFIDDVHGFDFTLNRGASYDLHGHGTHIAGIIAKSLNQKDSSKIKFMVLNYYHDGIAGQNAVENSIKCVRYAIQMGADVINYSGGGLQPNREERLAFLEAEKRGILVVAAAGNESSNSEKSPFFPANYGFSNIISVTATDSQSAHILPTSNFGRRSVHIAANGNNVVSTLPGGHFGNMTGTSQATAFTTGQSLRILISNPELIGKPESVIDILIASSSPRRELAGKTLSGTVITDQDMNWLIAKKPEKLPRANSKAETFADVTLGQALQRALAQDEDLGITVRSGLSPK